jgi:single-strand DNA-binding protein
MTLNKAMIIGNLTRDPELKTTSSGTNVASFSVATSLVWNDANGQKQQKPEFHNVIAWRRLAEICGQYLRKGSKVFIEGRLQTTDWTGQDGVKRYRTEIVAENMIMLDSKNSSRSDSESANNLREELKEIQIEEEPEEEIRVENIPF